MSQVGEPLPSRMKSYEMQCYALPRVPKVIRLDGRAFGTFLKGIKDTFDSTFMLAMNQACISLVEDIGGTARMAYLQSDECSIVLNDDLAIDTQAWFGNNVQKMTSISASIFTKTFSLQYISQKATIS